MVVRFTWEYVIFPIPWKFWNERDIRTVLALDPDIKNKIEFEGEKHNPLSDCLYQIKYTSMIWNKVKN
jgi:hypothetical protein